MKVFHWIFVSLIAAILVKPVFAYTITTDPQYVVMNLASVNELNWAAPEEEWQSTIKPQVVKDISEIKATLPKGTQNRKLAWSTLMEYMNFPLDTPSETSIYAIKMRRILELAEEQNLPVFIPLNGFQWWDELPELYNWWDPDGTHTPQTFFARQKTKDFRERFIKGYNPENRWNVDWQNFTTPMQLNVRNWGGGGFRLAPPPNLLRHTRTKLTYRDVLESRLNVILQELTKKLSEWEKEGKEELFVGISLGTEISLNASVTASDEFKPYGYRAAQDLLCASTEPTCGISQNFSASTITKARQDALQSYLFDLSLLTRAVGLPKQRVYTHVWADIYSGSARYEKYGETAFTPFSRGGISLYGSATNPFALPQWLEAMKTQFYPAWGAVEYSTDKVYSNWSQGMENTLNSSISPAKVVVIYNLREHRNTPAIPALASFLRADPKVTCSLPEIIPVTSDDIQNPATLQWRYVPENDAKNIEQLSLHVSSVHTTFGANIQDHAYDLSRDVKEISTEYIPYGSHDWYIEAVGCRGAKKQFSEPRIVNVQANFLNITPLDWIFRTLRRLR
ncbi:hypothetical protein KBC80_03925 [Candidatus Woesebacteria bacterium]|nr:hypothetical protein [Candidatus Woesebacteria bacterium]